MANIDDLHDFIKNLLLLTNKNTFVAIESFSLRYSKIQSI